MHCYQWIDKISEVSLDQAIKNNHSYLIICDKEDFNENQLLKKILPEKWEKGTKKKQMLCRKSYRIYFRTFRELNEFKSNTYRNSIYII